MTQLIPDYGQNYIDSLHMGGRAKTTIKQYTYDLGAFFHWLTTYKGDTDITTLRTLTPDDITAYFSHLSKQKDSDDTIRRLGSVLNGLFQHLEVRHLDINKLSPGTVKRPLNGFDFVSDKDFDYLLKSVRKRSEGAEADSAVRRYLVDRNLSILLLMRRYGVTTSQIHSISMEDVNFAQRTILIPGRSDITLTSDDSKVLLQYYNVIPKLERPRYRTTDPLFVPFNNRYVSFQYDNQLLMPKRLSVRAIQKMIKDEVSHAGLPAINSTKLRNTCVLDMIRAEVKDEEIVGFFGFASSVSLTRYKVYAKGLSEVD